MTFLGKLLVFVQLGASLILATLAIALYSNRIDWTNTPAKGEAAAGLLKQRQDEYAQVSGFALRPADTKFRAAQAQLIVLEYRRPGELAWYNQELKFLAEGANDTNPCRRVKRHPEAQVPIARVPDQRDPAYLEMEPPRGADGQPVALQSLQFYEREFAKTLGLIDAQVKRIGEAADRDKAATEKLNGPRGLHNRLRDETIKQGLATQEYKDLRPEWLNTEVELNNLRQLRQRLIERVQELGGKVDVARAP